MKKARLEENIRHGRFKGLEVTDVLKAVQCRAQRREARVRREGTPAEPASDVTISQQQIRPGSAAAVSTPSVQPRPAVQIKPKWTVMRCFFFSQTVRRLLVFKRVTIRVLLSGLNSPAVRLRLLSAAWLISGTPTPPQAEGPKSGKRFKTINSH